ALPFVCFLCARSEGSAATLRHGLYELTNYSHIDVHLLYGFPMQQPALTLSARVSPCPLAPERGSVQRCSPCKAHFRDETAQQRCPQDNGRPDRERTNGLASI